MFHWCLGEAPTKHTPRGRRKKKYFIQLSTAENITLLSLGDRVHYRMNKAMISADLSSITSSIYYPLTMSKLSNLSESQ